MAIVQVMARELTRAIPFVTPQSFVGAIATFTDPAAATSVSLEFDTIDGFAEPSLFNTSGAFPGANTPKTRAVGPWTDVFIGNDGAVLLRVEYAADRGCVYHTVAPDTAIAASTLVSGSIGTNLSTLRITGRFVRFTLINNTPAVAGVHPAVNVEFGTYVRSV